MLTYQQYQMAFHTAAERDRYFRLAERGAFKVPAGTTMRHVLATNLGIWGSEDDLLRDAARLMLCEINTWAEKNHDDKLALPPEALLKHLIFVTAFSRCTSINRREIDGFVKSGFKTETTVKESVDDLLDEKFTAAVHESLRQKAEDLSRCDERLSDQREDIIYRSR